MNKKTVTQLANKARGVNLSTFSIFKKFNTTKTMLVVAGLRLCLQVELLYSLVTFHFSTTKTLLVICVYLSTANHHEAEIEYTSTNVPW